MESNGNNRKIRNIRKSPSSVVWSESDKLTLLKALKKYAHTDIASISKELPNKSLGGIKSMINKLIAKSRSSSECNQSPVSEWLQSGLLNVAEETLIPQALLFIYLFEAHPPPLETGKCDYRAIYHFLYHLTSGQIPPELSPENKEVLYGLLSKVIDEVWPSSQNEILEYFVKTFCQRKAVNVYPGKKPHYLE